MGIAANATPIPSIPESTEAKKSARSTARVRAISTALSTIEQAGSDDRTAPRQLEIPAWFQSGYGDSSQALTTFPAIFSDTGSPGVAKPFVAVALRCSIIRN